ncbi:MAG: hypothetical protein N3B18_08095 [Desulfobacterota bacterium]|nr:hypothetical protein [Thermodesulfobacteriota bacterium]
MERSKQSLLEASFYTSGRPFTTKLLFKLWGSRPDHIVIGQQIFLIVSWLLLSVSLGSLTGWTVLRLISVCVLPLSVLWWNIFGWTFVMLSEAVSFAFFALWFASLIFFIRTPSRLTVLLQVIIAFFFSFTRDNVPFALVIYTILLVFFLRIGCQRFYQKHRSLLTTLILAVFVIFSLQSWSIQKGQRHQFCLVNVILQRILPHNDYTQWFIERGMPSDGDILSRRGTWASSDDNLLYRDPRYARFMHWVSTKGPFVYGLFLLTHLRYTFSPLTSQLAVMFSYNLDHYTLQPPPLLGLRILQMLLPMTSLPAAVVLTCFAVFLFVRFGRIEGAAIAALFIMVFFNALLIYHADAMEVPRHSIMNMIMLEWCTWACFLVIADTLYQISRHFEYHKTDAFAV